MQLCYKIHSGKVIAICDSELLGRQFTEKDKVLDLKTHEDFYQGRKADLEEVKSVLKGNPNVNINAVGDTAVNLICDMGLASRKSVMEIDNIKTVQVYYI